MVHVQMQRSRRKNLTCFENANRLLPEMRVTPLPAGWAAAIEMSEGTSSYRGSAGFAEEANAKAVLFPAKMIPFPLWIILSSPSWQSYFCRNLFDLCNFFTVTAPGCRVAVIFHLKGDLCGAPRVQEHLLVLHCHVGGWVRCWSHRVAAGTWPKDTAEARAKGTNGSGEFEAAVLSVHLA